MINIHTIRKDTPHCNQIIHFNNAGASLMPRIVVDAIKDYLDCEEKLGGYETAHLKKDEINEFYIETGHLLNCNAKNIAFCYNATDAYNRALSGITFISDDVILTSNDDYVSNQISFLSLSKRFNVKIEKVNNLENGDLDLDDFENKIVKFHPKLVAVTHIPTNSGLIQDIESVGMLCEKYDIFYLVDACQSVGQLKVDVQKIKCDFLSATGRKFLRGPRGTGFLYVSDKILNSDMAPLFLDMRGADWTAIDSYKLRNTAQRFELWELPYSSLIGLTSAIQYTNSIGIENIFARNSLLINLLRSNLSQIPGVEIYDRGTKKCNILTFRIKGKALNEISAHLNNDKINFSVSDINSARIDFTNKQIDWAIRLSPHYFNTEQEVALVTNSIGQI